MVTPLSGIYQIENRTNGKRYVGSAANLVKRWRQHLQALRRGDHHNRHLQRAFDKHGEDAFEVSLLAPVENRLQLIPREQHYLDTLNPEYNILPTAGSSLGLRYTEETCRKLSAALTGRSLTPEHRRKLSEAQKGKRLTEDHRRKLSEAKKAERHPNYGKPRSKQTRRKISESKRGKPVSAEHRAKLSEAGKAYWRRIHLEYQTS